MFSAGQQGVKRAALLWGEAGLGLLSEGARASYEMCLAEKKGIDGKEKSLGG